MPIASYTNPVYGGYFADPFVLRIGTDYYAYGTRIPALEGRVFEVLRSVDLVDWTSLGGALEPVDSRTAVDYWAPEVALIDDRYYLYYSTGIDDRFHRLRVAVADRPEGPFVDAGRILTPDDDPFTIDAHPFRDDDGEWYLYYARDFLDGDRPGTALVVDRMLDPLTLAGERRTVLRATADWQIFEKRRSMYGAVYDWHTLEGPFVVKRQGRYWCFYSGGCWTDESYGLSYAVADSPLGPFVEPDGHAPHVLRTVPGKMIGPGHASITTTLDGSDHLVYHAWDPAQTARRMCIDRLEWTPDGPRTAGPTWTPQAAPSPAAL
ncbi:MAG: family 43 glycosylhydrolase [Chloroflexi bacterium]|jgi:GH43 family beta-xylosidase|nr:family 43 glycosylhydrolase [Chloroflexota bacterium]MBA3795943.1 family 43 glycosylhydrolase [Chloroflexota bacterium]